MKRYFVLVLMVSMVLSLFLAAPVSAAAATPQIKPVEEDCLVIFVDGKNLGEKVAKEKWQWVVDTYASGGEKLKLASGDWYYYTKAPFNLGHPLVSDNALEIAKWLKSFLKKAGRTDFPWERVFFYDADATGGYRLEAQAFGYSFGYMQSQPDGAFTPWENPFNKNVILLGFPDVGGIHGEVHAMENIMNNILGGVVWGGYCCGACQRG
jgi:hypothetical protein